jgi:hypothetical protein
MRYKIVIRGSISADLLERLEQPTVGQPDASSTLTCEIVDQTKLQAVLSWLQDEGVEILSLEPAEA